MSPESPIHGVHTPNGRGPAAPALRSTPFSEVQPERVEWLWPGRVPIGMVTLLIGDPGLGKSLLTCHLAAQVSVSGFGVLMLTAEDSQSITVRPRLEVAGADLDRVLAVERNGDWGETPRLPTDTADLRLLVEQSAARLVVIDPLMAHLDSSVNSWRDQDMRRALAPLQQLADEAACAVLVVAHLNKQRDGDAVHRTGGSIAIPAAARSALLMARDPEDPEGQRGGQRVVAHAKCNVAPLARSVRYRIDQAELPSGGSEEAARLLELGESDLDANGLLQARSSAGSSRLDEAIEFLREALADGPRPTKEIEAEADRAGISLRTLKRAKDRLNVQPHRRGFGRGGRYELSLPMVDHGLRGQDGEGRDGPAWAGALPERLVGPAASMEGHGARVALHVGTDEGTVSDGGERGRGGPHEELPLGTPQQLDEAERVLRKVESWG